jgi:nicotinate-nucleotide adenylyltransferase
MNVKTHTGVLGGRFDPIHLGHLTIATVAQQTLELDQVLLLPSRLAPHRTTQARGSDRLAMVTLAANGQPHLVPSNLELQASGPSYTAVTLRQFREQGYRPTRLFFIIGADAFAEIESWHDYPNILNAAHFVVVSRPGYQARALFQALPALRHRIRLVSRETRRRDLKTDATPNIFLVDAVTPAVSSTDIRNRVMLGKSLDGLVPSSVAGYIERHHLYETDNNHRS